jgi:hypothetical protein
VEKRKRNDKCKEMVKRYKRKGKERKVDETSLSWKS